MNPNSLFNLFLRYAAFGGLAFLWNCQTNNAMNYSFQAFPDSTSGPEITLTKNEISYSSPLSNDPSQSITFPIELSKQQENIFVITFSISDSSQLHTFLKERGMDTLRFGHRRLLLGTAEPEYAPFPYLRALRSEENSTSVRILFKGKSESI